MMGRSRLILPEGTTLVLACNDGGELTWTPRLAELIRMITELGLDPGHEIFRVIQSMHGESLLALVAAHDPRYLHLAYNEKLMAAMRANGVY